MVCHNSYQGRSSQDACGVVIADDVGCKLWPSMNSLMSTQSLCADTVTVIGQRPSKPEMHKHIDAEEKNWIACRYMKNK